MQTFILIIYIIVVLFLVGSIMLQPSEGGGLGGSGGPNFMTARGAASTLSRVTSMLAFCFVLLALVLFVLQNLKHNSASSVLKYIPKTEQVIDPKKATFDTSSTNSKTSTAQKIAVFPIAAAPATVNKK